MKNPWSKLCEHYVSSEVYKKITCYNIKSRCLCPPPVVLYLCHILLFLYKELHSCDYTQYSAEKLT